MKLKTGKMKTHLSILPISTKRIIPQNTQQKNSRNKLKVSQTIIIIFDWLRDTLEKWEQYCKENPNECPKQEFDIEDLLTNPKGARKLTFARFAIKFSLLKLIDEDSNEETGDDFEDKLEELETVSTL